MQHKYVTPKSSRPWYSLWQMKTRLPTATRTPCVQCTFRCKREFEIYAYVENIGMVVKHLDEWVAPGSAQHRRLRFANRDRGKRLMEAKAEKGE